MNWRRRRFEGEIQYRYAQVWLCAGMVENIVAYFALNQGRMAGARELGKVMKAFFCAA
jgi:hypothetical protein